MEQYTVLRNDILKNYHKLSITNDEMLFFIHLLSFLQKGEAFPSFGDLRERLACSQQDLYNLVNGLVERKLLAIDQVDLPNGKLGEQYSLAPLFAQFEALEQQEKAEGKKENEASETRKLFRILEEEFGRGLSPIEFEIIGDWLSRDHYSMTMILEALKVAVMNDARNLRYMDKILLNWQQQPQNNGERRGKFKTQTPKNIPPVPMEKLFGHENEKA